jgi:hypothetical protein
MKMLRCPTDGGGQLQLQWFPSPSAMHVSIFIGVLSSLAVFVK